MSDIKEQKEALLNLVRKAVQQDQELREKLHIGNKFKFISEGLQKLFTEVETDLGEIEKANAKKKQLDVLLEDEILVYVYLFNAQGIVLQTWQKTLNPSVFYEYSVNRPIYTDKAAVENYIRSKPNRIQNAFATIAIKKIDLLPSPEVVKDSLGNTLVKVREGSLKFEKLFSFTHNNQEYVLTATGEIVKKTLNDS